MTGYCLKSLRHVATDAPCILDDAPCDGIKCELFDPNDDDRLTDDESEGGEK